MHRILFFLLFTPVFPLFATPELYIREVNFDFGEKKSGKVVQHEFLLENRGDENLKISDIKTSCGCTTSGTRTMLLKPGEMKPLAVKMDLKGRSGQQRQSLTLRTNDPNNRISVLTISGQAIPDILVEPRTLNLQEQELGKVHQGELRLTSSTGEPFEIVRVTAKRENLEVEIEQAADGLSAKIQVTSKPQEGQGHFTDVLEIETTNPNVKQVRVLVMWQISTGISISPGQVNLILDEDGKALNRYLLVRGYPGLAEPLEVTGVEWPGQDVEISVQNNKKFGWRIHLKSFVPKAEMKDSEILIHTNAEGFDTLKVPVRMIERRSQR